MLNLILIVTKRGGSTVDSSNCHASKLCTPAPTVTNTNIKYGTQHRRKGTSRTMGGGAANMRQDGRASAYPYGCLFRRPTDIHDLNPGHETNMVLIACAAIMRGKDASTGSFHMIKYPLNEELRDAW